VEAWIARALAATDAHHFAVLRDGTVVGSTSYLNVAPEHGRLEIGNTWNHPSTWGAGVNTEAKYLLLRHAFEALGARRVEFKTDAKNERARAALAAIPAELEGIQRKHMVVRGGERRDSAWYAVIDDDWPTVRSALERRIAAAR
jgi:RimJ/RimL family protein N-acetyltransferase